MSAISSDPQADPAQGDAQPLQVLVAEDDPLIGEYLALTIERLGCHVTTVPDGETALSALSSGAFDVLVTDWMMPRLDGIELIRRVRSKRERYLHVIMMTARRAAQTIRTALEAGADDFLYKPIDDIQIELGLAAAKRVVALQRRLQRRNRDLAAAHERTRKAYDQIKADLSAAAELQRRLLPTPDFQGVLRYALSFRPSLDIGGDSLGLVRTKNGRALFFNIDVSGHGVPAALNSFALHSRLARLAPGTPDELIRCATTLNAELAAQPGDEYMTMVVGLVEADASRAWLLRAGHPMPMLLRGDAEPRFLEQGGYPLGLLPDADFELSEVDLSPGDRILVYSDGVTDGGLGESGLIDFCARQQLCDIASFLGALEWRLLNLRNGAPPDDDVSMLLLERAPAKLL
jgi:phosphoserine phosphatase RsbU/P